MVPKEIWQMGSSGDDRPKPQDSDIQISSTTITKGFLLFNHEQDMHDFYLIISSQIYKAYGEKKKGICLICKQATYKCNS